MNLSEEACLLPPLIASPLLGQFVFKLKKLKLVLFLIIFRFDRLIGFVLLIISIQKYYRAILTRLYLIFNI